MWLCACAGYVKAILIGKFHLYKAGVSTILTFLTIFYNWILIKIPLACRDVTRVQLGEGYIYIFVFCPTNSF